MRQRLFLGCWFALFGAMAFNLAHAASVADFPDFSLRSGTTTLLPGRMYIPPAAVSDPATPRPLILFMHGAGESGTNNLAQINGNLDNLLAEAKRRGAFLYAPQTNGGWGVATILDRVMTMVNRAVAEQPVDDTRLYVTGLSMGGGGTWNMLNRFDDRFAAAAAICAVSPASGYVPLNLVDQPIWAFHARNDGTVSFNTTRTVVGGILAAGGAPAPAYPASPTADFNFTSTSLDLRYTEYLTGGHGIWGRVYNTPAMYDWLFSHSTVPEPGGIALLVTAATIFVTRRRLTARRSRA